MRTTARRPLGPVSATALLAALGCARSVGPDGPGGPDGGADAQAVDPLVGTWRVLTQTPMPSPIPGARTTTLDVTFAADMTVTVVTTVVFEASAGIFPGCTQATRATGQTWSTARTNGGMQFTVTGGPMQTSQRTGCIAPGDNAPPTSTPPGNAGPYTFLYTITGDVLSWTETDMMTSGTSATLRRL